MMSRNYGMVVLKYSLYAVILIVLYVLQETPAFLTFFGVKPILVFPYAVCIAVFEGEFTGALAGMLAGLFCDLGGITLFGFNGLVCLVLCAAIGLIVLFLMRPNLLSTMLLGAGAVLLRAVLEYLTCFSIWGYDPTGRYFLTKVLPCAALTIAVLPLCFLMVKALHNKFEDKLKVS